MSPYHHYYLLLFKKKLLGVDVLPAPVLHSRMSLPLMLQETAASLVALAAEQKTVSLTLIFGHHLRAGPAPEVSK